jgi:hypothetical protein
MSTLRATNIKGRSNGVAPAMPDGVVVTGVVTATSFSGSLTGDATGLTGTPDITVRNITGVAGTFSGDLNVSGTLTYEDVTNIDSIGIITARSNVSIADSIIHTGDTDTSIRFPAAGTVTVSTDGNERARVTSGGGIHFNNGELIERANVTAGKLSDDTNIDLENGMVHYFTTTETTTSTPNIRVNSTTSLDSVMDTGDTIAVTIITTAAAAGYSAQLTIDGGAVTENWVGGSAPSSGGSSGVDIYNYTIIKTGSATFTVVANYTATS